MGAHTIVDEKFVDVGVTYQQDIENGPYFAVLFFVERLLTDVQIEAVQCARNQLDFTECEEIVLYSGHYLVKVQ